jgi:hypothetical protein
MPPNTVAQIAATNAAVAAAQGAAEAINAFETANPALYAQMVGSLGTYGKSALTPAISGLIGGAVTHYGLSCGAVVTAGCWSADNVQLATLAVTAVCSAIGAAVMHWISKSPARAVLNAAVPAAPMPAPGRQEQSPPLNPTT